MIDAHVHLQMAPLMQAADGVMARARQQGVRRLVVNGTKPYVSYLTVIDPSSQDPVFVMPQ